MSNDRISELAQALKKPDPKTGNVLSQEEIENALLLILLGLGVSKASDVPERLHSRLINLARCANARPGVPLEQLLSVSEALVVRISAVLGEHRAETRRLARRTIGGESLFSKHERSTERHLTLVDARLKARS